MNCFSEYENGIEYRYGGETVRVLPWGENSFRVLCCPFGKMDMQSAALLQPENITCDIVFEKDKAVH